MSMITKSVSKYSTRKKQTRTAALSLTVALATLAGVAGTTALTTSATAAPMATCPTLKPTVPAHIRGIVPEVHTGSCTSAVGHALLPATTPYTGQDPPLVKQPGVVTTGPNGPGEVTITPVYWTPPGLPAFSSAYKNVTSNFLKNVAADSGKTTNSFGLVTQYTNSGGTHLKYLVHYGTPLYVSDSPQAGTTCTHDAPGPGGLYNDGTNYKACITDASVVAELSSVLRTKGLPSDKGHLYAVYLPEGEELCFSTRNAAHGGECTGSFASLNAFCGYHSNFGTSLYAALPWPIFQSASGGTCSPIDGGYNQYPNGVPAADVQVSTTAHELAETITDPLGTGWLTAKQGDEIGDLCAGYSGHMSGTSPGKWSQTINGAHYNIQMEFSNAAYALNKTAGCKQQ